MKLSKSVEDAIIIPSDERSEAILAADPKRVKPYLGDHIVYSISEITNYQFCVAEDISISCYT